MKAVILAAGEGTRLRPFTVSEPKVMIPAANKPILEFIVNSLVDNGITDIIMVVGYRRERIMSHFKNGEEFGAKIDYVTEWKQLGTAHALLQAEDEIDDEFLVLPGDNVISSQTITDFLEEREKYSILITNSDEPSKYGVVTLTNGEVKEIVEKPEKSPSHLISTGIYSFSPEIFDYIKEMIEAQRYDITSVVQRLQQDERLTGILTDSTWIDAVYPWDLIQLNSAALSGLPKTVQGVIEEGVTIKGNVVIGEGATIRGGTYIQGPTVIGEGCEIGPNVCILPSTSIGQDTKIEPFTVVKESLVMNSVRIGPNSTLEKSVIGDGVKIGSNFSTYVGSKRIPLEDEIQELESIGCMVAEDTRIGGGVTTEPGVIIGAECEIRSGKTIREDIPSEGKIY